MAFLSTPQRANGSSALVIVTMLQKFQAESIGEDQNQEKSSSRRCHRRAEPPSFSLFGFEAGVSPIQSHASPQTC